MRFLPDFSKAHATPDEVAYERKQMKRFIIIGLIVVIASFGSEFINGFYGKNTQPVQQTSPTPTQQITIIPSPTTAMTVSPTSTISATRIPYPTKTPLPSQIMKACPMDAKLCPDGKNYVGRSGPNCEFGACPTK